MYKVYVWTNSVNGKRYIGTTGTTMEKRAGVNGYYYQGSPKFYAAIQKYGFDKFHYDILADGLTKEEAAELEARYIKEFDTMNPDVGYNLQEGGFPDRVPKSNGTRVQRISNTLKQQRSSPEYRKIMSARMQKVWDDPERHAAMLEKRKGKSHGGNPKIAVFCEETGIVYSSQQAAAEALGVNKAHIAKKLFGENKHAVIGKRKGRIYHIHKVLGAQ
jgi:group I intron endonuclease